MFHTEVWIPFCYQCYRLLKPVTVLMGKELDQALFGLALSHIFGSDLLIVAGTNLQAEPVDPLALFPL